MNSPPHIAGSFPKCLRASCHKALMVVLALATLVGCQGLSSSHSSTQPPPSNQLTLSSSALDFPSVVIGNTKTLTEVVTNRGGSNATISQDTVTGTAFSVSGFSPPVTLTPGQSYTFSVIFVPQSVGSVSGNLSLVSNASNPTLGIPLSGTGTTAPPQHKVALSWTENTSSNIASYNIYRGTLSGSYSKIGSVPAPSTTYTDSSVTHGLTYYYVATAVDATGQESTYSNQATAVIPSP